MRSSQSALNAEKIFALLNERFDGRFLSLKDLPSPSLFKDMDRAVTRITEAIKQRETITVVGDYDVDGVVATAIMRQFFDTINVPIRWIIPNRFNDGYGLSPTLLPKIKGSDLVITVDNGITAADAALLCKEQGIDLIITDHHTVPDRLPQAYAIINPKQSDCSFPHKEICGAQVAWYLCSALNAALKANIDMKSYLEMVSVAIIADVIPLLSINRTMVIAGLKLIARTDTPFLRAYKELRQCEQLSAEDIAFGLAPLLNSAGRIEDASLACEFVSAPNIYEARHLLEQLMALNEKRKQLEEHATNEALNQIDSEEQVIVVAGEGWHEGVVGITAARLAQRFERPAIVLSCKEGLCKGSGRSFHGCDLYGLVNDHRELLEKFGGHTAAVGLTVVSKNLQIFRAQLQKVAARHCSDEPFHDPALFGLLPFDLADMDMVQLIAQFEPFGEANPRPKFMTTGVEIVTSKAIGKEQNHLSLMLRHNEQLIRGIQFKTREHYREGEQVDLIYHLHENHFRGQTSLQLMIEKIVRNR